MKLEIEISNSIHLVKKKSIFFLVELAIPSFFLERTEIMFQISKYIVVAKVYISLIGLRTA